MKTATTDPVVAAVQRRLLDLAHTASNLADVLDQTPPDRGAMLICRAAVDADGMIATLDRHAEALGQFRKGVKS